MLSRYGRCHKSGSTIGGVHTVMLDLDKKEPKASTPTKQSHILYLMGSLLQCSCIAFSFIGCSGILLSHYQLGSIHPFHFLHASAAIIILFSCIQSPSITTQYPLCPSSYILFFSSLSLPDPLPTISFFTRCGGRAVGCRALLNMVRHGEERQV